MDPCPNCEESQDQRLHIFMLDNFASLPSGASVHEVEDHVRHDEQDIALNVLVEMFGECCRDIGGLAWKLPLAAFSACVDDVHDHVYDPLCNAGLA